MDKNMVEKPNRLARMIDDGGSSLTKDNWANGLFSLKSVVARVVKACVPEFANFTLELIADECLEDFQDDSGRCHPEVVKVLLTKRPLPNGSKMDCDLLIKLNPPVSHRGEWKPQLLNIEIQNDSRKLDRCIRRGMLYASGLYYMEYGMIYTYPKFEDAWKVNSIWICPTAPDERQGTILDFRTTIRCDPADSCNNLCPDSFDILRLTFVNVGGDSDLGQKDIRGFVWALTAPSLSPAERKKILKEDFGMDMTQTVEETIDDYDWFLDLYGRKRVAAEKKQCREEGERLGLEKGKREDIVNMLKMKYPLGDICKITGMRMEEILRIAKDNKLNI